MSLSLPLALLLGAIVSPPDAVAATAIADRVGLPRNVASILEGESLVNDATALVVYAAAVGAATTNSISAWHIGLQFLWAAVGGPLIGVIIGWTVIKLRQRIDEPIIENTVSLLTPFAAYLPADFLGSSGVLATVAAGFVVQRYSPVLIDSATRLRADGVWELINFVLNGLIFILIGLQLHPIFLSLAGNALAELLLKAALVCLAARVVRIAWIFVGHAALHVVGGGKAEDRLSTREASVIAWAGMRGVVSLAAAQGLPLLLPHRNFIVFLTFSVILTTLVFQGLTFPALIRRVGLGEDDAEVREELRARLEVTHAALAALDGIAQEQGASPELVEDVRAHYSARAQVVAEGHERRGERESHQRLQAHRTLQRALIGVERQTLIDLLDRHGINNQTLRRVQRDLDLEEIRLADR